MENEKDNYIRMGWFVMAATLVCIILANTLHAQMAILVAIGFVGLAGGITLLVLASKKNG